MSDHTILCIAIAATALVVGLGVAVLIYIRAVNRQLDGRPFTGDQQLDP